jgi:hypothetical protein
MAMELIQGGGETVALKPRLVKNEQGQICMSLDLGSFNATLPLPEHLAGATEERLQEFFDAVVPEITKNLQDMARKERRKSRRK